MLLHIFFPLLLCSTSTFSYLLKNCHNEVVSLSRVVSFCMLLRFCVSENAARKQYNQITKLFERGNLKKRIAHTGEERAQQPNGMWRQSRERRQQRAAPSFMSEGQEESWCFQILKFRASGRIYNPHGGSLVGAGTPGETQLLPLAPLKQREKGRNTWLSLLQLSSLLPVPLIGQTYLEGREQKTLGNVVPWDTECSRRWG